MTRTLARLGPALENRNFALLWVALLLMGMGTQMLQVAIGWQVYGLRHSALDLGWIGLAEFIPMFLFALPAGQLADRFPRRVVFGCALVLGAAVAAGLTIVTLADVRAVTVYIGLAFGAGTGFALGSPAMRALPPTLVPPELLSNAMVLRSIAMQMSQMSGPALGGVLYAIGPAVVYIGAGMFTLSAAVCTVLMRTREQDALAAARPAPGLRNVLDGLRFIRHTPILLGAISLDLFAVLFGGAVALLPVYASSILHIGSVGLGILRAAPAIGALAAAIVLTRRPIGRRAGRTLLVAVAAFGAATIVFGLSRTAPLSFVALVATGYADMYSMNIRSTTAALATPDGVRGRVTAVEMVFISASNQLGAFESGLAAFALGAAPAVAAGGAITVGLALAWQRLFPALATVDRMEDVRSASA
jgi:hypothetical protein